MNGNIIKDWKKFWLKFDTICCCNDEQWEREVERKNLEYSTFVAALGLFQRDYEDLTLDVCTLDDADSWLGWGQDHEMGPQEYL